MLVLRRWSHQDDIVGWGHHYQWRCRWCWKASNYLCSHTAHIHNNHYSILHAMKAMHSNSWRNSRMLLIQCIPSIPCSFYSHIPCRSYVTNRMGDLVPPTWPSSTQWDKGSCITIRVWIYVTQYLIHAVMHPLHIWTSVRASTRRWYSISTKSPYSAIPFDLRWKLHVRTSE